MKVLQFYLVYSVLMISFCIFAEGSYKAAVVEYTCDSKLDYNPKQILKYNVEAYLRNIEEASQKGADIIVFPQYGLTSLQILNYTGEQLEPFSINISTKEDTIIPCMNNRYHRVLFNLSCSAKKNKIYVVTHILEKDESKNKLEYFNTLVVFDRSGQLITKYRSQHSTNEHIQRGYDLGSFTTDFGITFGLLLGNDILYKTGAWDIFSKRNITNVIASMAWKSESPFLTALSVQAGYTRATGVNLLASGLNEPNQKYGGTGIYYSNGRIAEIYISPSKSTKLLVQDVAKIEIRMPATKCQNNSNEMPRFRLGGSLNVGTFSTDHENMENYTFADLARFSPKTVRRVCSAESTFCCDFNITVSVKDEQFTEEPIYKLVAFHGIRSTQDNQHSLGIRTCGIISCETNAINTCGKMDIIKRSQIKFESIQIRATFVKNRDTFDQPITATYDLIPLTGYTYCEELVEENRKVYIEMLTTQPVENLLTYGIFGRTYNNDGYKQLGVMDIEELETGLTRNVILIIILTSFIFLIALIIAVKCIRRSCEHQFQAVPTK